jgi:type III restriction enzyme
MRNFAGSVSSEEIIVNNPYEEPSRHWRFVPGEPPVLVHERRKAGYYERGTRRDDSFGQGVAPEQFRPMTLVNDIREKVSAWRAAGYPSASPVTRLLLRHWREKADPQPFFCQMEAVETAIWLAEGPPEEIRLLDIPKDGKLVRHAFQMATGTGKTLVMAMLIVWSVLNKSMFSRDGRFARKVLVVAPNVTVAERLRVLRPEEPGNFYERFNLVPRAYAEAFADAVRVHVTNWHQLQESQAAGVAQRVYAKPSEEAEAKAWRLLKDTPVKGRDPLLVINDEAHHCHRGALWRKGLGKTVRSELERATRWAEALDVLAEGRGEGRGVIRCLDFSATPFYGEGTGPLEGTPFEWTVSSFGLADAIECGLVKIPRLPRIESGPERDLRRLYAWAVGEICGRRGSKGRRGEKAKPDPSVLADYVDADIRVMVDRWRATFAEWTARGSRVPPVLIVVCADTKLAEEVHRRFVSGVYGEEFRGDFTLRLDSDVFDEAGGNSDTERELREKARTVGREFDENGNPAPGRDVRCVVSVNMLSEGWDAPTVTHIIGLRPFLSQLLCEQVVGRGLRKTSHAGEALASPEYVDVMGVPFEVIPVKEVSLSSPPATAEARTVRCAPSPDRADREITLPVVKDYRREIDLEEASHRLRDIGVYAVRLSHLLPSEAVLRVEMAPEEVAAAVLSLGESAPLEYRPLSYSEFILKTASLLSRQIQDLASGRDIRECFRISLKLVREFLRLGKLRNEFPGLPFGKTLTQATSVGLAFHIANAFIYWKSDGFGGRMERLEAEFERKGGMEVFRTGAVEPYVMRETKSRKALYDVSKSHIIPVVCDSPLEEKIVRLLEGLPFVEAFVKNDYTEEVEENRRGGVAFSLPYVSPLRRPDGSLLRRYYPDFFVRLVAESGERCMAVLEAKGQQYDTLQAEAKAKAGAAWVRAVNRSGAWPVRWAYIYARSEDEAKEKLIRFCRELQTEVL